MDRKDQHELRGGLNSRNTVVEVVFFWCFLAVSVIPVLMGCRYQAEAWHRGKSLGSESDGPEFKSQSLIHNEIFRRYFFMCVLKIKVSLQQSCVRMRLSTESV